MVWRLDYIFVLVLLLVGTLQTAPVAHARDSEAELQARIEQERNPVKKAKLEIKLARIKLGEAQAAYNKGDMNAGAEVLNAYVGHMESSWQALHDSGRVASRKPQGFKELEIALREDTRLLEDLKRSIPFFNRSPVEKVIQKVEKIRAQVLQALFPVMKPTKAPKHSANPGGVPGALR
jgi:hypothetical protein